MIMRALTGNLRRLQDPGKLVSLSDIQNISECNFLRSQEQDEDEIATARDIAEFEKNKHLTKPCSTLDGFSVSSPIFLVICHLFDFKPIGAGSQYCVHGP